MPVLGKLQAAQVLGCGRQGESVFSDPSACAQGQLSLGVEWEEKPRQVQGKVLRGETSLETLGNYSRSFWRSKP